MNGEGERLDPKSAGVIDDSPGDVTLLLAKARSGSEESIEELVRLVYKELRKTASALMRRERQGHTLSTTDLAHEAYLRLFGSEQALSWADRKEFFMSAAVAMRRVLIDHVRRQKAGKRIPKDELVPMQTILEPAVDPGVDLLVLDRALQRLAGVSPRQARVVELRYFMGLTEPEIAKLLGVSLMTVSRDWRIARLWLRKEMQPASDPAS